MWGGGGSVNVCLLGGGGLPLWCWTFGAGTECSGERGSVDALLLDPPKNKNPDPLLSKCSFLRCQFLRSRARGQIEALPKRVPNGPSPKLLAQQKIATLCAVLPCSSPEMAKKTSEKLAESLVLSATSKSRKTHSPQTHHPKVVPHRVPKHLTSINPDIVVAQTFKKIPWKSCQQITPKDFPQRLPDTKKHHPMRRRLSEICPHKLFAIPSASILP